MITGFVFDRELIKCAIESTFKTRHTTVPVEFPIALTNEFAENLLVVSRWNGFILRNNIQQHKDSKDVIKNLRRFFSKVLGINKWYAFKLKL